MWAQKTWWTLVSVLLFMLGAGAATLTVLMNRDLGASLGYTSNGQLLQSNAATIIDVAVIMFSLFSGLMLRQRRWGFTITSAIAAIIVAVASFVGVVGFGAKERIAKSDAITRAAQKNDAAVTAANKKALERGDDVISWLKSSATVANGRVSRGQYIEEAAKLATTPIAVVKYDASTVAEGDPQAEVLAQFFGNPDAVGAAQKGLVIGVAALLVGVKLLAFFFASAVWPKAEKIAKAASVASPSTMVEVKPGPQLKIVESKPEPKIEPEPAKPVDAKVTVLSRERERKLVADFFASETVAGKGKAKAGTVYHWFGQWCQANGHQLISLALFGRIASELGVPRDADGRFVYYRVGRNQKAMKAAA